MKRFYDRMDAGAALAQALKAHAHQKNTYVLGLPRGGVVVAAVIAQRLALPLDVFVVRKLGVPMQPELAMGAIAVGDVVVLDDDMIRICGVTPAAVNEVLHQEQVELLRRTQAYRGDKAAYDLKNKQVILVDDGIATGATMRAAISALRQHQVARIIVAVPVASGDSCQEIAALVDEVVCLAQPTDFYAVGAYYENFSQTSDEEVIALLHQQ